MNLDPGRVKAANKAFFEKYPDRKGTTLSPDEANYSKLADEWKSIYEGTTNPVATEIPNVSQIASVQPVQPCLEKPVLIRFETKQVKDSPPCDFEKFVVKCQHCGGQDRTIADVAFWRESGNPKDNFLPVPAYSHRKFSRLLEVIAGDCKGHGDKISVKLEGGPGYCSEHALIEVWSSLDVGLIKSTKGTTTDFEALVPKIESPAFGWGFHGFSFIWYHFFPPSGSAVYTVVAKSCPNHPEGPSDTGLGVAALSVTTYPCDEWKLEVDLQPNFKRTSKLTKFEDKYGNEEFTKEKTTTKSGWSKSGSTDTITDKTLHDDWEGTYTEKVKKYKTKDGTQTLSYANVVADDDVVEDTEKFGYEKEHDGLLQDTNHKGLLTDAGSKIKFSRNGAPFGGTLQVEKLLNVVKEVSDAIQVSVRAIQNFQPKIGWSIELDYSILSGKMELTWGNKEFSDHTVYRALNGFLNFDIVNGSITVKYGVEVGPADDKTGAYIYGKATGSIFAKGEVKGDPDQSYIMTGKVGGAVKGDIGLKGSFSGEAAFFLANVEFGIEGAGSVTGSPHEPPYLKCEVVRLAVEGKVHVAVLWGLWHYESKETFCDKKTIYEIKFPNTKPDAPQTPTLIPCSP